MKSIYIINCMKAVTVTIQKNVKGKINKCLTRLNIYGTIVSR